jgi:diguanylate cyclase (GGDEF)-like protein/PAS domain S-box-containing protein
MDNPNLFYSTILLAAGVVCLLLAALVLQMRATAPASLPLSILLFALSFWDITYAAYWAGIPGPRSYFWLDITYLGVVVAPPAFLAFAMRFSQNDRWLKKPLVFTLATISLLIFTSFWTDPWFGIYFAGTRVKNVNLIIGNSPLYWAHIIYSYILLLVGCVLLLQVYLHSKGLYRRQAVWVLTAAIFPWLTNILYVFGLNPLPGADNTPFVFSLTAFAFAYALIRYHLLDIVPIAKDVLIENMSDGVVVLDSRNRIVDINPRARTDLFGDKKNVIGESFLEFITGYPDLTEQFHSENEVRTEVKVDSPNPIYLDVRISILRNSNQELAGRLLVWRDITKLKKAQLELTKLAVLDPLTQAYNRRYFIDRASIEVARAKRYEHPLSVLIIDLDHFKEINDSFGHPAGDQALISFVEICRKQVRQVDTFARFGGEEFALLLPETELERALEVAERLRTDVNNSFIDIGSQSINTTLTISIGVSTLMGAQDTLENLLHRADDALYKAKEAGRNSVAYA